MVLDKLAEEMRRVGQAENELRDAVRGCGLEPTDEQFRALLADLRQRSVSSILSYHDLLVRAGVRFGVVDGFVMSWVVMWATEERGSRV